MGDGEMDHRLFSGIIFFLWSKIKNTRHISTETSRRAAPSARVGEGKGEPFRRTEVSFPTSADDAEES